jgi:tRNA 2-thiocytidine biosynthesis protein TtcA
MADIETKLLHYTGKAIADYKMIQHGDRLLVCLSGGKDSFTMLRLLTHLQKRAKIRFELLSFTLDQQQPGWDDTQLRDWLAKYDIPHVIHSEDTYSIVTDKIPSHKTYCSLCSRLRRGIIYRYAENHGFNKVALGHHRDDLITSLLMSIFYNGEVSSMPPKLLSDNKKHMVIRPLAYCQEKDIQQYATENQFPIIPCNLCGSQQNLKRQQVKQLIQQLAEDNPKIPSNILHALQSVKPSQLMDRTLWDFANLDMQQV